MSTEPTDHSTHYRFYLQRVSDVTGKSGTGRVADGVYWPDGRVTLKWRGEVSSTANWDSLHEMENIHGHDGLTYVVWLDYGGEIASPE